MTRHHITIPIILLAAIQFVACDSEPYQSPPPATWYTWNDVGLVRIARTTDLATSGGAATTSDTIEAVFRDEDSVGLEAGTVSFEGLTVPVHHVPADSPAVYYLLAGGSEPLPIRLGGTRHLVKVSGAGAIPAYEQSIASPNAIGIVSPANGASISRRDGFQIVYIESPFGVGYFQAELASLADSSAPVVSLDLHAGSGRVLPGMLASIPAGPMRIAIREVMDRVDTVGGRRYRARFTSTLRYAVTLTE